MNKKMRELLAKIESKQALVKGYTDGENKDLEKAKELLDEIEKLQEEAKSNDMLNKIKQEDNYKEIKEALMPKEYNLIVTPKEIDDLIENMKDVVAMGINNSL